MGDYVVNKVTKKRYLKTSPKGKKLIAGRKARRKAESKKTRSRSRSRSPKRKKRTTKKRTTSKKTPSQKLRKWENLYAKRDRCVDGGEWWNYKTNKCNTASPSEKLRSTISSRNRSVARCNESGGWWDDGTGKCRKMSPTDKLEAKFARQFITDGRQSTCKTRGTWWKNKSEGCYDEGESPLDKLRVLLGTKEPVLDQSFFYA